MLTVIIGGSASGKSALAERLAADFSGPRIYVATMEPFGDEAAARIARHHEQRRSLGFQTLECYVNLDRIEVPRDSLVLLEDLPNLAANERFRGDGNGIAAILPALERLEQRCASLVVVTGELFAGGRDYQGDTLDYLKELALLHRQLAERADLFVEVAAGLPNVWKGELPW